MAVGVVAPFLGNSACWKVGYTFDDCCPTRHGRHGNADCFDGVFTYEACCLERRDGQQQSTLDLLNECQAFPDVSLPRQLQCRGTSTVDASDWSALFQAHRLSQILGTSFQGWPDIGELFARANKSRSEGERDCVFGLVTAMLHALPAIERQSGLSAALGTFSRANDIRARAASVEALDCRWNRMTNHAMFGHYAQLLGFDTRFSPCPAGSPRVFVYDTGDIADRPLSCSRTGFWSSEVYVDRFLRQSACREHDWRKADFFFVPAYLTCWELKDVGGLSVSEKRDRGVELSERIRALPHWGRREGLDHVFLFGASAWQLEDWRDMLSSSVVLAVESHPIQCMNDTAEVCYHCHDCFQPWKDIVIPPVTPLPQVTMLLSHSLPVESREILMSWHGQHANSSFGAVQKAYRSTNETVRLSLLRLAHLPNVSIGGPVSNYAGVLGNSRFCLCPKGASSYTSRIFEAMFAGCVPVLLSDDMRLPFDKLVNWTGLSIRWPMHDVDESLYEYLLDFSTNHPERLLNMQREVAEVRCWFDYFATEEDPLRCSPYTAILKGLGNRKEVMPRGAPPFAIKHSA